MKALRVARCCKVHSVHVSAIVASEIQGKKRSEQSISTEWLWSGLDIVSDRRLWQLNRRLSEQHQAASQTPHASAARPGDCDPCQEAAQEAQKQRVKIREPDEIRRLSFLDTTTTLGASLRDSCSS
ncbi:hypothetical protein HJFPF1_00399 [Paramyrothecium foliicola]|nr:hypothetical protein HJFPF1_00399 [Paramyrothecium foliicola]